MSGTSASLNSPKGSNILQRIKKKIQGTRSSKELKCESDSLYKPLNVERREIKELKCESDGLYKPLNVERREIKELKCESDGLYKPLNVERREIRLLHIKPSLGLYEQPQCFLKIVSLDDDPQFEALSYAWGDARVTRPIRLENREWHATVNLEAGLRNLRSPSEDMVIWVDALCIDQRSIDERNSQVLLMKTIYSNAKRVKVWLGEPVFGSYAALKILEHIGYNIPDLGLDIPFSDIRVLGEAVNDKHVGFVNELMNRPWWNRVWVLQEHILAKDVTLHCGRRSIDFSAILENGNMDKFIAGWEKGLLDCTRTINDSIELYHDRIDKARYDLTFAGILARGCGKACTDVRDSIYGLLGLVGEDLAEAIKPDYNIPLEKVLQRTAVAHISCTRSLSFFSFTTLKSKAERLVPTWVPVWPRLSPSELRDPESKEKRRPWRNRINRSESILDFKACATRSLSFDSINENTILLNGKCSGEVTEVSPDVIRHSQDGSLLPHTVIKVMESWQKFFDQFADHTAFPSSTEGRKSPFWRIFIGDRRLDAAWEKCEESDYEAYQVMRRDSVAQTQLNDVAWHYWASVVVASADRRLFATEQGYIGLGPDEMQKGDHVYILSGGNLPYILRPVSGPRPRTFELVGDCYLQGIMYGEAAGTDEDYHDVYLE